MMTLVPRKILRYLLGGISVQWYFSLAVVLLTCFLFARYSQSNLNSFRIEFTLETEQPVLFEIYYDIGKGFNEVDHQSVKIDETEAVTTVSFCVPVKGELRQIRFDPAKKHVSMVLHTITLYYDNDVSFAVPLDTLHPQNQILSNNFDGQRYSFETAPGGVDPIFLLTDIGKKRIITDRARIAHYAIWMIAGVIFVFFMRLIGKFFYLSCPGKETTG